MSGARLVGLRHLSQTERRACLYLPPRLRLYLPYKSLVRRECYDNWWKVARFLWQVVAEHGDAMQAISNVWLGGMKHFEGIQRYVFTHKLQAELANRTRRSSSRPT